MIVLINPHAGGGTAMKKWNKLDPVFPSLNGTLSVHRLNGQGSVRPLIREAVKKDETLFIAAGGDGTVNLLVNAILENTDVDRLPHIRLGAIGLGSSNDFHKPYTEAAFIKGIPFKIDFSSAKLRDVGCIELRDDGRCITKYFLNNASAGITADANAQFNAPGSLLAFLKRVHPATAVLLTALRAILAHKNTDVILQYADDQERRVLLSNLAIIKNPHIAGTLRYRYPNSLSDGHLQTVLCENLSRLGLLRLMYSLGQKRTFDQHRITARKTTSVTVKSPFSFALEFDGEVIRTRMARFSLLSRCLRVCTC